MKSALPAIQVLAKIGKILSKIIFILCIVGAAGCLLGIIGMILDLSSFHIGSVTIHGLIDLNGENLSWTVYTAVICGFFACAGELVLAKFAENYFKAELAAGTPFTFDGAKLMMRLGILAACIPIGISTVCSITVGIMSKFAPQIEAMEIDVGGAVGLGITFIILSLLCKYGAEISPAKEDRE